MSAKISLILVTAMPISHNHYRQASQFGKEMALVGLFSEYCTRYSQPSLAWLLLSILFNVPWLAITGLIMVYIQMVMVIKTPYHCEAEHCYYRIWADGPMATGSAHFVVVCPEITRSRSQPRPVPSVFSGVCLTAHVTSHL